MSTLYHIPLSSGGKALIEEYDKNEAVGAEAKKQHRWMIQQGLSIYDDVNEALKEEGYIDPEQTPTNVVHVGADNTPTESYGMTHAKYQSTVEGPAMEVHSYRWHKPGYSFTLNIRTDLFQHSPEYVGARAIHGKVGWNPQKLYHSLESQHSQGPVYQDAAELPTAGWEHHPDNREKPQLSEFGVRDNTPTESMTETAMKCVRKVVRWGR